MRDAGALVAGIAVVLLGTLLMLDAARAIDLTLGYALPAVLATAGAALLAFGLTRKD